MVVKARHLLLCKKAELESLFDLRNAPNELRLCSRDVSLHLDSLIPIRSIEAAFDAECTAALVP